MRFAKQEGFGRCERGKGFYKITVSEQPVNIYWMFAVAAVLLIASFMLGRYQKIAVNRKYRKEASK